MKRLVVGSSGVLVAFGLVVGGCGSVGHTSPADGSIDVPTSSGDASIDGVPPALGTQDSPARTCGELALAGLPSAVYWLRDAAAASPAFQVYCEQQLNGGGWAMVENSVRRDDGSTTTFWQFTYDARLKQFGTPAADQNYYDGSLYRLGTEYMDVFTDLPGTTRVAALMTATGINPTTMRFIDPSWMGGNNDVFNDQFASGWSSQDHDDDANASNCAVDYGNVAQHYGDCWVYNLGANANAPVLDGGVGPHVNDGVLTSLGLALQPSSGGYSQVARIARFTRW